jgi:hypothetical protein
MERANETTEAHLIGLGILETDYSERDPETRKVRLDSVLIDLENAAREIKAGNLDGGSNYAFAAAHAVQSLERRRAYLTEIGYGIVRQQFPMALCFLPARFAHLAAPLCTCGEGNQPGLAHCVGCVRYDAAKPVESPAEPVNPCAICGEAWDAHRTTSGNTAPYCVTKNSRPGDTFISSTRVQPTELVYQESGLLVRVGDAVTTYRGDTGTVESMERPRHAGSTGRVYIKLETGTAGYYPSVIRAEWR